MKHILKVNVLYVGKLCCSSLILFFKAFVLFRVTGELRLLGHTLGQEAWYTLDESPVYHQACTNIDKHIHTFLYSVAPPNDPPCLLNWES